MHIFDETELSLESAGERGVKAIVENYFLFIQILR